MACCLAYAVPLHIFHQNPDMLQCTGSRCFAKLLLQYAASFAAQCRYGCSDSHFHKLFLQGVTCWLSMCGIQKAVQQCLGVTCASAFMLLCAIQFHLPFYMSRTLPNTFATAVLGFALADWVTGAHPRRLICLLAFSTVSPGQLLTDTACRYLKICILCCIYAVTPVYRTATVCRCYQPTGETIHGNSVFIIKSL